MLMTHIKIMQSNLNRFIKLEPEILLNEKKSYTFSTTRVGELYLSVHRSFVFAGLLGYERQKISHGQFIEFYGSPHVIQTQCNASDIGLPVSMLIFVIM